MIAFVIGKSTRRFPAVVVSGTEVHSRIENRQHWILDVTFAEDASRIRKGSAPEIAAALRRMALTILQRDTTVNENIRGKRLRAGWDEDVLTQIYAGFTAV